MPRPMSLLCTIEIVVIDQPTRLHRVTPSRNSDLFLDAFRSHYERGMAPRGPENRAAAIHMALSMFDSLDVAARLATRVPKLGGHVTTLELQPDLGICIAKTGGPAHWSVWARPLQLDQCTIDVVKAITDPYSAP
ncbi:hypothetical protein [Baekduia sp. Peel2402]|uniref:hypothetical protein n=1 Tax=Baekduia sp. Peel2402 TaxID=3458296 RepID=UPI00403E928A